jgi:hypothetical protein
MTAFPFSMSISSNMGKGKLSGSARKEINQRRAAEIARGKPDDTAFGRVTKLLGHNHVLVAIPTKTASKEIRVRITNLFQKKGATPITTRDIVAIFVGKDFNPDEITPTDQFDITAILTTKQASQLVQSGDIPRWMVHADVCSGGAAHTAEETYGWVFGDDGDETEAAKEEEIAGHPSKAEKTLTKSKKNAIVFDDGDEGGDGKGDHADIDIDDI